MIKKRDNIVRLDTANTTLVLRADTAELLYYGKRLRTSAPLDAFGGGRRLFSVSGREIGGQQSVALFLSDGGMTADFAFSRARLLNEQPPADELPLSYGAGKTLELKYVDAPTRVALYLYFTVYDDGDVITARTVLFNGAKKPIRIRRLMSLQLDLPGSGYTVHTFEGAWGRERAECTRVLRSGTFSIGSVNGASSANCNPFVYVENTRGVYGTNLVYSGNHAEIFDCDGYGKTRILTGINDHMFDWTLAPGESFCAPEAVMCYAANADALQCSMHAFVNEHIVRGKWKKKERPVLFNNWEGTYFDFNEEKLLGIARCARQAGAELFVLDDGWFGKRNDDTCSLGDWFDNVEKTGGGLAALGEKVRALGIAFGIWVEPEMISEDSELYRTHPQYAMKVPGRTPVRMRNQLMLNFADERVQNYVIRSIADVLARSGAAYVKWDFNRVMTDCYGKNIPSGEYFHRYILGYYRVVRKLVKKFPNVLFEGCASGGGRFDLGNLCFFPQIWTSDNTDARARIAIQAGTARAYPQSTMGAHVSVCPNHQTGDSTPMHARFAIACGGVLGYELDPTVLSAEEQGEIERQIAFYKEYRKLLQWGTQYRLEDQNVQGFITVSEDLTQAIAVVSCLQLIPGAADPSVSFKGLEEGAIYEVTASDGKQTIAGGDALMNGAFTLSDMFDMQERRENSGCIMSRMYIFKKCKRR